MSQHVTTQAESDSSASERVPVLAGSPTGLRDLGYGELWLQDWLVEDPRRLGLGDVEIIDQEQNQPRAGTLDLLAVDQGTETYYSVEVQLGEVDASHSFRVFDYWARNRLNAAGGAADRPARGRGNAAIAGHAAGG